MATRFPEPPHCGSVPQSGDGDSAFGLCPIHSQPKIVVLDLQPLEAFLHSGAPQHRLDSLREGNEVRQMLVAPVRFTAAFPESVSGILAHSLQQPIACGVTSLFGEYQTLVGERSEEFEDRVFAYAFLAANLLGCRHDPAARKDG